MGVEESCVCVSKQQCWPGAAADFSMKPTRVSASQVQMRAQENPVVSERLDAEDPEGIADLVLWVTLIPSSGLTAEDSRGII